MNVLLEIVSFYSSGQKGPLLSSIGPSISDQDLRLFCIKILHWLRAESRYMKMRANVTIRSMSVAKSFPWASPLIDLLKYAPNFGAVFEAADDNTAWNVSLNRSLSASQIREILKFAEDNFNPPLMKKDK